MRTIRNRLPTTLYGQPIENAAQRRLEHYRLMERNFVPGNFGNSPGSSGGEQETKGGHLYPAPSVFPSPTTFPH